MEIIQSKDNSRIKTARKLLQKKYRDKSGSYLIEGFHLLEEARKAGAEIRQVFVEKGKGTLVSHEVLKSLSDTESPQGVVAEVVKCEQAPLSMDRGKLLVLENVQDPGNVGTLIRTADAFGFAGVICVGETADIYSPKVLRSAQGSHFHLPVVRGTAEVYERLGSLLVTTLSKSSVDYREIKLAHFALLLGNEGAGVSPRAIEAASRLVHIPMLGQAESLNVAVAGGILMSQL